MKKLGEKNFLIIARGVKMLGTFDPEKIFDIFAEDLYVKESKEIYNFLAWVHNNKKAFGSGNYELVFAKFKKSTKKRKVKA
jgi:hypothetical protein